jgi:hypothetical protein
MGIGVSVADDDEDDGEGLGMWIDRGVILSVPIDGQCSLAGLAPGGFILFLLF